jgi:hypothetical protein
VARPIDRRTWQRDWREREEKKERKKEGSGGRKGWANHYAPKGASLAGALL